MNICIYGCGRIFEKVVDSADFLRFLRNREIFIRGISDQNPNKIGKTYNIESNVLKVMSAEDLSSVSERYTYIYITTNNFYEEIRDRLIELKVPTEKIIPLSELVNEYYSEKYDRSWFFGKRGVEIGGPSDIFEQVYDICEECDDVNYSDETVWWSKNSDKFIVKGKEKGKIYIADAVDMSVINDNTYDFLLSSNNIEHIANPLKALLEFKRILCVGGVALIVVPDKDYGFDHLRPNTTISHIISDYKMNVDEYDLQHLYEILELHDYDMDEACGGKEQFIARANLNYENRCLHHHVFSPMLLSQIGDWLEMEALVQFSFAGCHYIVLEKN